MIGESEVSASSNKVIALHSIGTVANLNSTLALLE